MADANTRPKFYLPFPAGTRVSVKSYPGHNPDDKKMDMYAANWPGVVAAAPGVVHEHFDPGGIEIRHFIPGTRTLGNWFTVYLHMSARVPVGTVVGQGQRVGTAGSVGTGVKHLHFEELQDHSPNGDADTGDMMYPSFAEYHSGVPFKVPVGGAGLSLVSGNRAGAPTTPPAPTTGAKKIYQGAPVPYLIRKGSGQYLGLITGPNASHGGYVASERPIIQMLQRRLIACGFVPGVTSVTSSWADGIFQQPTADAVRRFQQRYMSGTQYFGQVWYDDWTRLFNL